MNKFLLVFSFLSIFSIIPVIQAEAASNPNLFVSAENSKFENYFSGSMVIEVVIRDNNIRDTDEGKGEPDVTINGKQLRMVQSTDGNWYAYFANVDKAQKADSTVLKPGEGLDFGIFCDNDIDTFGVSFSDTDGFFVPMSECTGSLSPLGEQNNVVRKSKSLNTNPAVSPGQIGLDPNAWPLVQLFSFNNNVVVQYNAAGGAQRVELKYDEMENISLVIDRELYPANSEVFLTINDFQLNQDPTDEDSWTFNIGSPTATLYQAYDNNGNKEGAEFPGDLVNLYPYLSSVGFENNGKLIVDLGSIMELNPNSDQPETSITGSPYSQIVTLVEQGPNSGIFENFDSGDRSTIKISGNAPRGETGIITYNDDSVSVLTGSSTASVSLQQPELKIHSNSNSLLPGTEYDLILLDPDQNINTGSRDDLETFRDTSLIPTLKIGNPVTLAKSSDVVFYPKHDNFNAGENSLFAITDKKSERLFIDTNPLSGISYSQISINLGVTASEFRSILIDIDSGEVGSSWINYDLRSFENDFEINDFSDTTVELYFGSVSVSSSHITIANKGEISSSQGLIQLDDNIVNDIFQENGNVFLVINFGNSNPMIISDESNLQPIIFDFFSFGLDNRLDGINNSVYRFELEETGDNTSTFEGTFEYAIANQLNILDANFIKTIRTINDDVKFFITDRSVDEEGIFISYSDLDKVGLTTTTSTRSDIETHSGIVSTGSTSYRFGQPVVVILNDPDLNLKSDRIDVYHVINDPSSLNVDTIGNNGVKMLEILIKDVRYKRCIIDGVEHGGLASTGFSLIETGPSTGIFEGVFKMPTQICNKNGTELISPAGGSIEIKYIDSRDASGETNTFSSLDNKKSISGTAMPNYPQISSKEFELPSYGSVKEIVLSGSVDNHRRGYPLLITLIHPDGNVQEFNASVTDNGNYKTIFTFNSDSTPGKYEINLEYLGVKIGSVSFNVLSQSIPSWLKDNARWWSSSMISDSEFVEGIEYLIDNKIIVMLPTERGSIYDRTIPIWLKDNARWWAANQISDDDFINSIQYLVKKGIIRI